MGEAMASDKEAVNVDTAAGQTGQAQIPAGETPYELSPEKMMMDNLFILGMLFFIFYFILIRPQQRRLKIHREMMKGLQKGNRIMTTGGIIGTITKLEGDDIIVVEVAQGVKVRIARTAVSEVMSDKSPGESANDN
jgi:preprotein translocase subunit YajC